MNTLVSPSPNTTAGSQNPALWRDRKFWFWSLGWLIIVLFAGLTWAGAHSATPALWWWMPAIILYVLLPGLDALVGEDTQNPPDEVMEKLENTRYYRWLLYSFTLLFGAGYVYGLYVLATHDASFFARLGLGFGLGIGAGLGINTAHELGHNTDGMEQWLAKLTLVPAAYGHFFTEHNRGHHVRVATPEDPASSRLGESFYAFWPRSVIGGLRSAWRIEQDRLAKRGLPVWHWQNHNLQAWGLNLLAWTGLVAWLGLGLVPWLLFIAITGFSLLEVVNYLEHYGLKRQKLASGRYERCQPEHSWNSNHLVTNLLLYQLQRHSDHHAHPTRSYQTLRNFADLPRLPSGYAGMIVLAYFPSLWRRVMDRRVAAHLGFDMTRANIQPGFEAEVMARWHRPAGAPAAGTAEG